MRIASCEVLHDSAELVAQSRILGVEALKALLLPLDLVKDSAEDVHEISGWVHFDDQLDRASKLGVRAVLHQVDQHIAPGRAELDQGEDTAGEDDEEVAALGLDLIRKVGEVPVKVGNGWAEQHRWWDLDDIQDVHQVAPAKAQVLESIFDAGLSVVNGLVQREGDRELKMSRRVDAIFRLCKMLHVDVH